jgi:hypothetical protein
MNENDENLPEHAIKLDGTMGIGETSLLTIIVKNELEGGNTETTYQFPFALVNFNSLNVALAYKFIMGYRIERQDKVSQ